MLYGFSDAGNDGWSSTPVVTTLAVGTIAPHPVCMAGDEDRQSDAGIPDIQIQYVYANYPYQCHCHDGDVCRHDPAAYLSSADSWIHAGGIRTSHASRRHSDGDHVTDYGAIFDKVGARWLAVIGLAITVITTWEFSNLTETMSYSHIMVIYTARMFGMSMLMMPIQTAGLNQLPRSLNAHGTAMSNTLRMVSGSIGTAILVTVMSTQAESKGEALMQSGLFDPKNQADLLKLGNEATIYGINYAFVIATWISVASFILALSRRPSRPKSRKPQKIRRLQQRTYNPIRFCAAQKGCPIR